MSQPIVVTTTCDQREILEQISIFLVDARLAACCQISGPVTSVYRWKDKAVQAQEWVCTIKTVVDHMEELVSEIKRIHSYDEPEIIATEIAGGSGSYLEWIRSEVTPRN